MLISQQLPLHPSIRATGQTHNTNLQCVLYFTRPWKGAQKFSVPPKYWAVTKEVRQTLRTGPNQSPESCYMGLPVSKLNEEGRLTRGDLRAQDFGFRSDPKQEVCENQSPGQGGGKEGKSSN